MTSVSVWCTSTSPLSAAPRKLPTAGTGTSSPRSVREPPGRHPDRTVRPASRTLPAWPAGLALSTGMPRDFLAPPGATHLRCRLFRPQAHRTCGGRPDRGTIQVGPGLGDALIEPGRDQGHWPAGRERVNPEVPVAGAAAAAAPALPQHQAPVRLIG